MVNLMDNFFIYVIKITNKMEKKEGYAQVDLIHRFEFISLFTEICRDEILLKTYLPCIQETHLSQFISEIHLT
jgi:hypothetical protein